MLFVDVSGNFNYGVGLLGSGKEETSAKLFGRDGITDFTDEWSSFGEEWQVRGTEPKLFLDDRMPQYPTGCVDDASAHTTHNLRSRHRRLTEVNSNEVVIREIAMEACSEASGKKKDFCHHHSSVMPEAFLGPAPKPSAHKHEIEKPVQPVTHNKSGRDSNFVRRTEQSYENSTSRNKATKMGAPAACSGKDFLLFQGIRKGTLQDASASLHMLHSDMQSSKDPRRQHLRQIGSKRCCGKKFPTSLVQILKLLPGNDRCNDCGKDESDGHGLLWASVTYGTILCKCCACRHLSRTKKWRFQSKKSEIKSLITSDWSLPEIMSMLEGGNLSFRRFRRETEAESIRSLFWDCVGGHDGDLDQPLDKEFEEYYFSKAAASYANLLEEKVLKIVDMLRSI
jgi:hypothetical protein